MIIRFLLLSTSIVWISACSAPEEIKQNQVITEQVMQTPNLVHDHYIDAMSEGKSYQLHYVSSEDSKVDQSTVVFVHGTPGSWDSFARYFVQGDQLRERFRLISIDRPGWGESGYSGDHFPTSLAKQSELIEPILREIWEQNHHHKVIVAGHSLGGSLVPLLAADYPQYIRGVVILAGDVSPELAKARWYNTLLDWTPSFMIPDMWYHSNLEVLELAQSLENAQAKFASVSQPLIVLQGTNDELVNPDNAKDSMKLFANSDVEVRWLEGANHIINMNHMDDVKQAIRDMDKKTSK